MSWKTTFSTPDLSRIRHQYVSTVRSETFVLRLFVNTNGERTLRPLRSSSKIAPSSPSNEKATGVLVFFCTTYSAPSRRSFHWIVTMSLFRSAGVTPLPWTVNGLRFQPLLGFSFRS